ncbi:MAG TPA: DUF721 domain-containing protein [Candidatus Nitrosotenuis sp.]|jgi:hypothetical protein|nr:DUF721 domain-containing protein [Candidatus Nitrosotenuis sp.]
MKGREQIHKSTVKLQTILGTVTKEIFQNQGFAAASIILDWTLIVGNQFANLCYPERIAFPSSKRRDGCLYLQASSVVAAEIAFYTNQIMDKINRYFGYPAVAKIIVRHIPLNKKLVKSRMKKLVAPELVASQVQNIQDKQLQQALLDLGVGIYSDAKYTA